MIRNIVTYPSPILLRRSDFVKEINDEVRDLLNDMVETMYARDGIGLAAPQIGVNLRLIVVDVSSSSPDGKMGLIKMINPEIVLKEGDIEFEEGCLSVPDLRVDVQRSKRICVVFQDEKGTKAEINAEGLLAVAIQHEIDHLDGKLIIDGVSRLKRDLYLRKRKKVEKKTFLV